MNFTKNTAVKKSKARKKKNQPSYINKYDYVKTSNDDMWLVIENNVDIMNVVPFYRDGGEDQLFVNINEGEQIFYCGAPYDNYAVTDEGRVWSFKTKKFIKTFYRPNSVIVYMNSTSNVKIKHLFKLAGWRYCHATICENLLKLNLLVNDYNN